jgi:hypothetical protein
MSFRQKTTTLFTLGLALLLIPMILQAAPPTGFTFSIIILVTSVPLVFSWLFNPENLGDPLWLDQIRGGKR